MSHLWTIWIRSLVILAVALGVAAATEWALHRLLLRATAHHPQSPAYGALAKMRRAPMRAILMLFAGLVVLPVLGLPTGTHGVVEELATLSLIAVFAWALVAATQLVEDVLFSQYDATAKDNLLARKLRTRVMVLRRVIVVAIVVISVAAMLMTFPAIRVLGTSLLASAGLVGLVAGLAAKPAFTNLIAGLQLALTQPIRIDDVVVVDGEWGWVEEINIAYVVVRIWDLRRLILPLSYFIEQPFQNWTYRSSNLLGYVHLYTDYAVDTDALREELHRILQATPLWDGQTWNLQLTQTDEHGVQLRALFSSTDSNARWDLMVLVREQLLRFLRQQYPEYLPRTRIMFAPQALQAAGTNPGAVAYPAPEKPKATS